MSSFTCISCRVAFTDGEVQRAHYKTDWHRYNLKRKVADMPPVTSQNFQERVLAQRASSQQEAQASSSSSSSCGVCNKRFSSANAHQNHLQSHKHQQAERRAEQEAQREVQRRNEKNLEKGLDRDARNEALKEALREEEQRKEEEQRRREGAGGGGGGGRRQRVEVEKPPRLVWLEEQAKRQEEKEQKEEEGAAAVEDDWEDVDEDDMEEEEEEEEETMDQENPACTSSSCTSSSLPGSIPVTDCLFCLHHSKSLMRNIHHMTSVHSFFIPDLPFLVDLRGLVRYLGEKVGAGNVCLWCNEKGRSFYSTEAVQSHMTDKSHCKLFTDGDAALEFADFYDFRSSYPDRKEGDDESDDDLPEDKNVEYDDETLELTLPSGARIGHRSLMRYYKQRFGFQKAVTLAHNQNAVGRVLRQYKALGWAGETGSLSQRHRDMKFVQILKSRWLLKTGMNHNTTRQKHFRAQVMF